MSLLRHIGIVTSNYIFTKKIFIELFEMQLIVEHESITGDFIDALVGIDNVNLKIAIFKMKDNTRIELLDYQKKNNVLNNSESSRLGVSHFAISVKNIEKIYREGLKLGVDFKSKPLISPDNTVKVVYAIVNKEIIVEIVEVLKDQAKYSGGN